MRPTRLLPVLALLLTATVAGAQEKRPIEVEDQFLMRRVGSPVVSPDGEWIAYTVSRTSLEDEQSYTRIYMSPAGGGEAVALTADEKSAGSPGWSPDGRYITFTASRDGAKNQVWALDRRGGEAFALTDVEQGIGGYRWSADATRLLLTIRDPEEEEEDEDQKENAPQDPWVIDRLQFKRDNTGYLTGNRKTHLYVLDIDSRELTQLTSGEWDESLGVWSPDGTRIAFASNRTEEPDGNSNSDIWIVSADLGEPTDSPMRVTSNEGSDGSPAWSPDGRTLAYTTVVRPDLIWYATTHLAVISADGGEPRLLTREMDRNVRSPRFSEDGEWIWFRLEDSGENHIARIRANGNGVERIVAGPLSASGFDWRAGTFAVHISTLDQPGEIFTVPGVDRGNAGGNGDRARITNHNDDFLATVVVAETKNVQFRSGDGTEVEGFVTFPPDYVAGQRYPTLLRIHGGPVSQYAHSFQFESQLFAANGYLVVRANPRGSSGYGQDFSAALWADWGNPDFQDVMAGIDYAIEQGWADPDRLGVGGWSYGGILTNYVITQTKRFQGAITGASEVLYIANYGHDHYQRQWEAELGLPWEDNNRETWERISPFNKVQDIETPTLIMGGEDDWNVPILNSEQLYQALRRRGVPTQLVVYPGQSHGIQVPSYQVDRYERYLAWYDKWVKESTKPVTDGLGDEASGPTSAAYVPGPGDAWQVRAPEELNMDPIKLQEAVDYTLAHETTQIPDDPGVYLRSRFEGLPHQEIVGPTAERGGVNGIVVKDGYIVAEWGDTDREDMTFSVTKSYLSTVAGLAFDDGLIRDLDDPIGEYVTDGAYASRHNSQITWHNLLQQTSEWEGTLWGKPDAADRRRGIDRELQTPGTFWEYNDVRVNLMAYSLLHLFRRPLPDVLRERIMDPIGASAEWRWHGYETSWTEIDGERMQSVSGGGHWGGGLIIDTRDHARFGLLALRGGVWGEERLVSSDWFRMAAEPTDIQPNYGYMWWLNTEREGLPAAPESAFYANGAGSTNIIYVDREHDLVTVTRWVDGAEHVNEFIRLVLESIAGTR